MNVAVIGLGLIGGSLAKSLKEIHPDHHFIGVDKDPDHVSQAQTLHLVDTCLPLKEAINSSQLILLAIPVDAIAAILPEVLNLVEDQVVIDFGSTKSAICKAVQSHHKRGNFVAAHPMAGTENTGPTAAISGLYANKVNIICEKDLSHSSSLQVALDLFEALKMKIIYMDPDEHDKHIAYVSHLSHISSFMLGLTVLDIEKDEKNIFNMAGSGFQSTVRLAMSSPEMWAPIFNQNKQNVTTALKTYIEYLEKFKTAIENDQIDISKDLMAKANDIRRVLTK